MNEAVEKRVTGFLGLCERAGQIVSGQEACVALIRSGKAALVLLDAASSDNTRKRLSDSCRTRDVPLYSLSEGSLGHSIGKSGRMVIALPDGSMAQKLLLLLKAETRL